MHPGKMFCVTGGLAGGKVGWSDSVPASELECTM